MKFAMISRLDDHDALKFTETLAQSLEEAHNEVIFEEGTARALEREGVDFSELEGDIAIVVGGDGSVLLAVQRMKRQIPILGINWGEVGFLAELEPAEASAFLEKIQEEGFSVERRMRIQLSSDDIILGNALNEAVIVTSRPAKMLRFSVMVDGISAERFRADGLLISTPTGSTAYAMSAGGPIVDPRIEGFLLVPLAPYLLSSRPHFINQNRKLEIRLESAKPAQLVVDGQSSLQLHDISVLNIKKAPYPALFVDVGKNFFVKVNKKLRTL